MSPKPELRLYNTLTRKKERLEPIDPRNVRVYACGPTVYDHLHIGNGRKINARASELGVDIRTLTDGMIAIFHTDVPLRISSPRHYVPPALAKAPVRARGLFRSPLSGTQFS